MSAWIQLYGLLFVGIILIPNIFFTMTHKEGFQNLYQNRMVECAEQIGRFGCFGLMIVTPPVLCRGFWFPGAKTAYIIAGFLLTALYCLGWMVFWRENSIRKALVLSILPSILFLESGILLLHIPLIVFAVLFAICHITISYQNAAIEKRQIHS